MVNNSDPLFNLIYAYTRKQAIEDGNLIDVTEQAKGPDSRFLWLFL